MTKRTAKKTPYFFISPYFILFIVFSLFPVLYTFYISFYKWNGFTHPHYIGPQNYIRLFTDTTFYNSLLNTFYLIVIAIPMQIVTALILAHIVKQYTKGKYGSALRLIYFLPFITTPLAIAFLFQIIFDWHLGTINMLLQHIGLVDQPFNWFESVWSARFIVIMLVYWKYFGYMMVIVFAGLSTISEEFYDAAAIDGATGIAQFTKITLPLLKPIITFLSAMSVIGGFQMFDEPQLLFGSSHGGPDQALMTVVMKFYDIAFNNFNFGYGSAMAYGTFVIILVLTLLTMHIINRGERGA